MDNLLNIDNIEMIRTLGFLHENVKTITHNVVQYTEDNEVFVVDLNDNIIVKAHIKRIAIYGTFIITSDEDLSRYMTTSLVKIKNVITNKEDTIEIGGLDSITQVGDQFLLVESRNFKYDYNHEFNGATLINIHLKKLYKFSSYVRAFKVREDNTIKTELLVLKNMSWKVMSLNKVTASVDVFDSIDIDTKRGLQAIGKQWDDEVCSISKNTVGNIKYQLCNMGKLVGKLYGDIILLQEFINTDFLMVYDVNSQYRENKSVCKGVIMTDGTEVIPPIYDDVMYLGNYMFILIFKDTATVHSLYKGEIFRNIPKDKILIHKTLPITIIEQDNSFKVLDCSGRIFDLLDITRYFECYSSPQDESILKINTGIKTVFVTRNLIPITALHTVAKLNTYDWVRI